MLAWTPFAMAAQPPSILRSPSVPRTGVTLLSAVRASLGKNPNIQLQEKQVDYSRGSLTVASGQFDPTLTASASRSKSSTLSPAISLIGGPDVNSSSTDYSLGLSKEFRDGITVTPSVDVTGTHTQYNPYAGQSDAKINTATVQLNILFPLLQGGGTQAVAATETAAGLEYEASVDSLHHQVASTVYDTVSAYWSYVAASQRLDILRQAEQTTQRFVSDIRKLIAADERPAADINLVLANLSGRTASRIAAEQALVVARQNLGTAMGLDYGDIEALPLPSSAFPPATDQAMSLMRSAQVVKDALSRRWDLKASQTRMKENHVLLVADRLNKRHALNLNVGLGYNGLNQGNSVFKALRDQRSGPNVSASIRYTWPIGNNVADGTYMQQSASYDQSLISTRDLSRTISANVGSAVDAVRRAALQLAESQAAVHLYKVTVGNEMKKLKLGTATILDVVTIQDQLVAAELNNVNQKAAYATAVARLRYETGYMVASTASSGTLSASNLTAIPDFTAPH